MSWFMNGRLARIALMTLAAAMVSGCASHDASPEGLDAVPAPAITSGNTVRGNPNLNGTGVADDDADVSVGSDVDIPSPASEVGASNVQGNTAAPENHGIASRAQVASPAEHPARPASADAAPSTQDGEAPSIKPVPEDDGPSVKPKPATPSNPSTSRSPGNGA